MQKSNGSKTRHKDVGWANSGKRIPRLAVWTIGALAGLGLLTIPTVATNAVLWLMPPPAGSFDAPAGDTLVVLGSGAEEDLPDLETYWRCVYAVRIFRAGSFKRIIVAGGPPVPGKVPVAAVMAAYLRSANVPADQVLLESSSSSTRENALFVGKMLAGMDAGRVVLLTSDYHTRRAEAVFRKAGVKIKVVSVPFVLKLGNRPSNRPMLLRLVLSEYAKLLWYHYKGWA